MAPAEVHVTTDPTPASSTPPCIVNPRIVMQMQRFHVLRSVLRPALDLPGDYTVEQAHDIIERVEKDLHAEFPDAEVLIHIDPEGHVDEPRNTLVEEDQFSRFGERRMTGPHDETPT